MADYPVSQGTWTHHSARRALFEPTVFDLLVVGGGVIGASIARDAAARGLTVALVEQDDFAGGASGKSTKLIHGGIRYLPQLRFGLIRQGLREQEILRRTADHLYNDLDFVIPLLKGGGLLNLPAWMTIGPLKAVGLKAGLTLYDRLGRRSGEVRHRRLDSEALATFFPELCLDAPRGGFVYRDAQTDDARLVMSLLKTAVVADGAVAASRMKSTGIASDGKNWVVSVAEYDQVGQVRSRAVVSATWASPTPVANGRSGGEPIRLSKGVHLVYRPEALGLGDHALVIPHTDDGRLLFLIPWNGLALVGTTDTIYAGDPGRVRPDQADQEYLQDHLGRYLKQVAEPPLAAFAGVRALTGGDNATASASREHRIVEHRPGAFSISGGKLSSARVIAAEAVDKVCSHLGVSVPSPTHRLPLSGAGIGDDLEPRVRSRLERIGLPAGYGARLIARYGTHSENLLDLLESEPRLRQIMDPAPIALAEVVYTVRHEAVATVGDFALRRTRLAWSSEDHGRKWARPIADLLAEEMGWSESETGAAVTHFEQELEDQGL
ncbi:MAG: glycerol-3-phosphate dehydrogenase/oxidase [Acidimicrobiia bacterium]|nr:glycerol-3-phosphate dehydrogenase/oxidase [Acidimicrobiia bacterium]